MEKFRLVLKIKQQVRGRAENAMQVVWLQKSLLEDVKLYNRVTQPVRDSGSALDPKVSLCPMLPRVYLISRAFINSLRNRYGNSMYMWYINTHLSLYI